MNNQRQYQSGRMQIFLIAILLAITFACQKLNPAAQSYSQARVWVAKNEYDSAAFYIKQAFTYGLKNPMQIVEDPDFYELIDAPEYRPQIRAVLQEHAYQDHASMVRPEEPGEPIEVWGLIVDENTQQPIENAAIELVHTDEQGLYFAEKSMWNPRIFAYLKSNKKGGFRVNTIRPGIYQDDAGKDVPAHIHFTIEAPGYRVYASEFTFEDDPVFKANGETNEVPFAKITDSPRSLYEVVIALQKVNN